MVAKFDLKSDAKHGSLVVAQISDTGEVAGAMTLRQWLATDTHDLNKDLPTHRRMTTDPPSLYLLDLCVATRWRNLGIGTALVETAFTNHRYDDGKQPYNRIFATARVSREGDGPSSRGLLRRLGFEELVTNEDYYADFAPKDPDKPEGFFLCPHCDPYGNGNTCHCHGIQMMWIRPADGG